MNTHQATATYSPDDNKIRLYPEHRLDKPDYDRLKEAGFSWAPKQECFVAPMWTPERLVIAEEFAGEVGDDDKTLMDRAEDKADRFAGFFNNQAYWEARAAASIRHAKYKERPDVRARRIKKLESEERKSLSHLKELEFIHKFWSGTLGKKGGGFITVNRENALHFMGGTNAGYMVMPRKEGDDPTFPHPCRAYDALSDEPSRLYAPRTFEEIQAVALEYYPKAITRRQQWRDHYARRLAYERAMLAADGGTVTDRTGPEVDGACKCWASPNGGWSKIQKVNKVSVTVLDNWGNGGDNFTRTIPFDKLSAVMSAADVHAARADGRLILEDDRGFRLTEAPKGLQVAAYTR